MNAELMVKLVHIFGDKAWVVKALVQIYESGDRDAIETTESILRTFRKRVTQEKEGSDA